MFQTNWCTNIIQLEPVSQPLMNTVHQKFISTKFPEVQRIQSYTTEYIRRFFNVSCWHPRSASLTYDAIAADPQYWPSGNQRKFCKLLDIILICSSNRHHTPAPSSLHTVLCSLLIFNTIHQMAEK